MARETAVCKCAHLRASHHHHDDCTRCSIPGCRCREFAATSFEELIAMSSFGTPAATALRRRTPDEVAQRIVDRVAETAQSDSPRGATDDR